LTITNESKLAVSGHDRPNQPDLDPGRAEALLKPIIKFWIVELMDCGGTNPDATCECITEEEPDLFNALGHERVRALCEELHRSEDLGQSEWYGARFYQFNKQYFDGRLVDYRIRVVYDVRFWINEPEDKPQSSYTDLVGRQILQPVTQAGHESMEIQLIHHMAHAATGTTADDDNRWLEEMARLKAAGAPVEQ
jgi:hypothetical protein